MELKAVEEKVEKKPRDDGSWAFDRGSGKIVRNGSSVRYVGVSFKVVDKDWEVLTCKFRTIRCFIGCIRLLFCRCRFFCSAYRRKLATL